MPKTRKVHVRPIGKTIHEAYFSDGSTLRYPEGSAVARFPIAERYQYARNLDERELDARAERGPYRWKGRNAS